MIEWTQVAELRDAVGPEDFGEVVEVFVEEVEEALDRLRTSSQPERLGEAMHFLKGSAMHLGFVDMAELCRVSEELAAAGQPELIDLAALFRSFEKSKAVFLADLSGAFAA